MSFLVDTNVVSELRKGERANANVRAWFAQAADHEIFLSVLVIGESRRGVDAVRRRDPDQAGTLERWLATIVHSHDQRILPVDLRVAEEWGRLSAGGAVSIIDTLLAATARVHGLVLVTRNVQHVAWSGVPCLDPFAQAS